MRVINAETFKYNPYSADISEVIFDNLIADLHRGNESIQNRFVQGEYVRWQMIFASQYRESLSIWKYGKEGDEIIILPIDSRCRASSRNNFTEKAVAIS